MPTSPINVLIIGAGTGGLCLAQGLKRAGIGMMNHLPAVKRKLVTSQSTFRGAGRDDEG